MIALDRLEMQERVAPSRPACLGTRRRRPPRATLEAAGASRSPERRAHSLDTDKQVQTTDRTRRNREMSVREWGETFETPVSLYRRQVGFHGQLLATYHRLWQDWATKGDDAQAVLWEKKWLRLYNCRNEWVGYRADCCQSMTQPVAVPIGCNDRLCPLCAWDRSRIARKRIKTLFDKLTHPVMITLTVPNKTSIRKHDFTLFRQRVRQLIAQHKAWIKGGVYSLETTYNRVEKTWHIHTHILADVSAALPAKTEKITLADQRVCKFTAMKLQLEFDWLRLWTAKRGKKDKTGDRMRGFDDEFEFNQWVREGRANRLKEWRGAGYVPVEGLSASEIQHRTEWNRENRRVVDLRPVTDREKVAYEVLKYITKVADFGDLPEAVEPFANAVKGARLIQTFGTWYGVKLDTPTDASNPDEWTPMHCACGLNIWKRNGVFARRDVDLCSDGVFRLKLTFDHNSRGTFPRPTIRALDEREE